MSQNSPTNTLVLATRNLGKIREFDRLLRDSNERGAEIRVLGLRDFPDLPDVEESGSTFSENALLKAREISRFTGLPAIADDSGLSIDALQGAPGIFSARWAGEHGNDQANIEKVLDQLRQKRSENPQISLAAHFTCVIAFHVQRDGEVIEQTWEGRLEGEIELNPRGSNGFGYDPIFLTHLGRTLGELDGEAKDSISHRGAALRAMMQVLPDLLTAKR